MAAALLFWVSLADESVSRQLAARFPDAGLSYVLLDTNRKHSIASSWPDSDRPISIGSLVKPLTALRHLLDHHDPPSSYTCDGRRCWLSRGHGRLNLSEALAQSCNGYFLDLTGGDRSAAGLDSGWQTTPVELLRQYVDAVAHPRAALIRQGLHASAEHGTGAAIGIDAMVKTGTGPCRHERRMPGDGFVIALYPATQPRLALLVRVHGAPGAVAAKTAGEILRTAVTGR